LYSQIAPDCGLHNKDRQLCRPWNLSILSRKRYWTPYGPSLFSPPLLFLEEFFFSPSFVQNAVKTFLLIFQYAGEDIASHVYAMGTTASIRN
jgi:hypothetical protein